MRLVAIILLSLFAARSLAAMPECTRRIADYYDLPVLALTAIHDIEGGRDRLSVRNHDGSVDRGRMQINSWWDDRLARYGIDRHELLNNGCTNIAVGAWILSHEFARFGGWFEAIAAYNAGAGHVERGYGYAHKVIARWRALYNARVRSVASR